MSTEEYNTLHENIRNYIVKDGYNSSLANKYLDTLCKDSEYLWEDVKNLTSEKDLYENYKRLYIISRIYSDPNSSLSQNLKVSDRVIYSLNFLSKYYNKNTKKKGNWWEWVIGIPMYYGYILTLIPYCDQNYYGIIDKFVKSYLYKDLTYANLASCCKNLIVAGVVKENDLWIQEALKCSIKAFEKKSIKQIKFARWIQKLCIKLHLNAPVSWFAGKEGLYDDGTFIQHTSIPYIGTYGIEVLQYAAFVLSIGMTLPQEIINILPEWIFAYNKAIFNNKMLITYCGRAVETINEKNIASNINRYIKEITNHITIEIPEEKSFVQSNADKCIYEHSNWRFVVSMCSDRTAKYESFNNQNKQGWYQNMGMTYLYLPDTTYTDYFNKVNPYRLPGVTCSTNTQEVKECKHPLFNYTKKDLECLRSGGVKFDNNHLSALMQVVDNREINARKSWFMVKDMIICVGTKLNKDLTTTVVNIPNLKSSDVVFGYHSATIKNFGTITSEDSLLPFDSGLYVSPNNGTSYLYTLFPGQEEIPYKKISCYYDDNVHILNQDGLYFFNFFEGFKNPVVFNDISLTSKEPSSIILQKEENQFTFAISDYTQEHSNIHLKIKGKYYSITNNIKCYITGEYTEITIPCKDKFGERIYFVLEKV